MATIAAVPYLVKDTTLTLGADDYSLSVSTAELVPTTPTASFKSINGVAYNLGGKASWVLNVTFAQDWTTTTSLGNYLFDHEGETVTFKIDPNGAATAPLGFQGQVVLAAGSIGGAADAVPASSVSFQVIGKPTRVTA